MNRKSSRTESSSSSAINNNDFDKLIANIQRWMVAYENIRAGLIIGSRAREDHPADEWSDLDIILLVNQADPILKSSEWLGEIGPYWLTFIEQTGDGSGYERRVLFEGGLDVDFAPISLEEFKYATASQLSPVITDVISRGVKVLIDKDGLLTGLLDTPAASGQWTPPDGSQFLNDVNDFWFHALWTAKHLRRGELWWAKGSCDGHMKRLLQQMMEWHTLSSRDHLTDTWMRGRFLEEWADPRAVVQLPRIFAHYDEEDIWGALFATMELYRWLAVETAEALDYGYPLEADDRMSRMVLNLKGGLTLREAVSKLG